MMFFHPWKLFLLYMLFYQSQMAEMFTEVLKVLQTTLTTPVSSAEAERFFSTLKRIKTWLRNAMGYD